MKLFASLWLVGLLGTLLVSCGSEAVTPTAAPPTIAATSVPLQPSPAPTTVATTAPATVAARGFSSVTPVEPTSTPDLPAPTTTIAATSPTIASAPLKPSPVATTVAFSGDRALGHVKELAGNIGIRAAGTDGDRKAADYIENYFKQLGLNTERPAVAFTATRDNGSLLTYVAGNGQSNTIKGDAVNFSGSGKLEAPLVYGGLGLDGQIPTDSMKGKIALIQRGQITFTEKVTNALAAGATGVIIYNNTDGPLNSATLQKQANIPVIGISQKDGEALKEEVKANKNFSVQLTVEIGSKTYNFTNVVAQRPASNGLQNAPVIIFGGHYDSVPAGPGANDNASGTAVVMELARVFQNQYPQYELRFIAFGGEEIGLAGSNDYVKKLSQAERQRIVAMVNIDMISVGRSFYIGGVQELTKPALAAATTEGAGEVNLMSSALLASSDSYSFSEAGIPVLFFNRPDDPNYHKPGDTVDKVQSESLAVVGRIVTKVIDELVKS
ncbi:MAG TPA: M20/M25/M40 family metallo-hydrolase [Chloroflexia bacterium]|nr:M20/M25/M40 family metallo-hydrolase [Chloroflexia bacterium]